MPIGVLINAASVFMGGILGALLKKYIREDVKQQLSLIFGVCALGMGIASVVLMKNMPAVIFSVIVGTFLGLVIRLGEKIRKAAGLMQKPAALLTKGGDGSTLSEENMATLLTIVVLFCASGTGIYGSMDSGMTGDHTILITKSILDIFTAMIFACQLGPVVSVIALPQLIIFLVLFYGAGLIYPLTTPDMINDFKACGGFLLLATAFRMLKLKDLPVADMIPAMVLVMPVSWLWQNVILPLF